MKDFFKKLLTFLLYGVVFWLPVALVVYIASLLFGSAEKIGRAILGVGIADTNLYTGFGIALCLLVILVSGILLKATSVGVVLSKIPVLGLFFGKGEVITISRLMEMRPCLFLLSPTCMSCGWILSEEPVKVNSGEAGFPLLNVYYPNVPSLVTGQVYMVRKETVMKLGNTSKEVIDLLLYAFRKPDALEYLPWEDESSEEFEKRAKSFGLN